MRSSLIFILHKEEQYKKTCLVHTWVSTHTHTHTHTHTAKICQPVHLYLNIPSIHSLGFANTCRKACVISDALSHTHTHTRALTRTHAKKPVHVANFPKISLPRRQTYPDVLSRKRKVNERVSHTPTHTHAHIHTRPRAHGDQISCEAKTQPHENQ